ncbi:putative GPI-anchored protein At3g06035 [Carex rostrata]
MINPNADGFSQERNKVSGLVVSPSIDSKLVSYVALNVFLFIFVNFERNLFNDTCTQLLKGINSYRASLNLTTLTGNSNACCLAEQLVKQFKGQPCTNSTGDETVPAGRQGSNRAIVLFWAAINERDRVDIALKDMAIVMKQQNRAEEAIDAIKSLRNRCSHQAQDSLDNIVLDLYKEVLLARGRTTKFLTRGMGICIL